MTTLNTPAAAAPAKALLGTKLGMTQIWDENGVLRPVTVVRVDTNVVTQVRTMIPMATRPFSSPSATSTPARSPSRSPVTSPSRGRAPPPRGRGSHLPGLGVHPRPGAGRRHLRGRPAGRRHRHLQGQGVRRCHEAPRLRRCGRSHGAHRNHRKPGSIGACATPGRIFKGLRMAGRMGHARRTVQNLKIRGVDVDKGVLLVNGAIPGPKGLGRRRPHRREGSLRP